MLEKFRIVKRLKMFVKDVFFTAVQNNLLFDFGLNIYS